jgi:two-component system sensor histidine kinase BaeS
VLSRAWRRLQPRLLLSYLLVTAIGIGGVVVSAQLVGPSLFDQSLTQHTHGMHAAESGGMTAEMRAETLAAFRSAIFQALLLAMVAATLVSIGVSVFVSRKLAHPIMRMANAAQQIAAGDYATRVQADDPEELAELASSLNQMASAFQTTEQRRIHLIGDVAHELRTPLTTLRGNLEGMLDQVIEPTPELLAQLYDDTTRLGRLVDDLGELSRVEAGEVRLELQRIAPGLLVERAAAHVADAFHAKRVDLRIAPPEVLPDVRADANRVSQVLLNLLSNALRYSSAGDSVTLSAVAAPAYVEFSVADTGIGIAPESLSQVFERFYRADAARSRVSGGSGIGLTIARAIVEAHGGTMSASSDGLGHGSTFRFTLPRFQS